MYTKEQVNQLQEKTTELLNSSTANFSKEIILDLRAVLRFHEYRYYVLSEPVLADYEYDQLFRLLVQLESAHPELVTPDSPTQRVGNSLNQSFVTVPHLVPMLSLDNSYNAEDLKDFDGLNKVLSIKTYDFKWKNEDKRDYGVLAHELQEVVSGAVLGQKDELEEDGTIKTQMVDYSKLVPVLIKAIQELNQKLQDQQQTINSLINR